MSCNRETERCKGTHPCCHKVLLDLLDYTAGMLDKHRIPYWLAYGTLLGAVRDHQIIPWDEDIDLGIMMDDANDLFKLGKEFMRDGYPWLIGTWKDGRVCTITIYASLINSLHIDIDVSTLFLDGDKLLAKGIAFPGCYTAAANICPAGLKYIEFEGKQYRCPDNPEEMLKVFYGDDWQTPKVKGWIKERVQKDTDLKIQAAMDAAGWYKWEPGRSVKE